MEEVTVGSLGVGATVDVERADSHVHSTVVLAVNSALLPSSVFKISQVI